MKPTPPRSFVSACLVTLFALLLLPLASHAQQIPGAQGFGALTTGGQGGPTLYVTSLSDDNPTSPAVGTFRWAVTQSGPRIVKFQVAGTIALKARLIIGSDNLTIDGS